MHALHLLARIISGILGLLFGYMGLFMFRDERGELQNRLADFWVRVNTEYEGRMNREASVIRGAAEAAETGMRWLFGEKLISLRLIIFSASASMASVGFTLVADAYANARYFAWLCLVGGAASLICGWYCARILVPRGRVYRALCYFALEVLMWLFILSFIWILSIDDYRRLLLDKMIGYDLILISLTILGGLGCDLVLLVTTRRLIKLTAHARTGILMFLGISFSALWGFLQIEAIRATMISTEQESALHDVFVKAISRLLDQDSLLVPVILFGIKGMLFNLLAATSIFIVLAVVLSHRIIWPILSRLINALYEWEVCTNKVLQLGASIAFLTFAFPWVGLVLKLFKP
jgi:hypothetical protein